MIWRTLGLGALALIALPGCEASRAEPVAPGVGHEVAAVVQYAVDESALPTVRLSPRAMERLAIQTETVRAEAAPAVRLLAGEIVAPPGQTLALTAPVSGRVRFSAGVPTPGRVVAHDDPLFTLTPLAPVDRDTRARAAREVAAAEANLAALALRVRRNEALVAARSGSVRALEEAIAARDVARADVKTARARLGSLEREPLLADVTLPVRAPGAGVILALTVADGQVVAAGHPLLTLVGTAEAALVRVPLPPGDRARLDLAAPASVRRLGAAEVVSVVPVPGPPTADPVRGTVDRYFALPPDHAGALGERVLVTVSLRETAPTLSVSADALVFDAWGGTWIYRCDGARFWRARVDPLRRLGDRLLLAHGPPVGACVVAVGAAELLGTEFPPGH